MGENCIVSTAAAAPGDVSTVLAKLEKTPVTGPCLGEGKESNKSTTDSFRFDPARAEEIDSDSGTRILLYPPCVLKKTASIFQFDK